MVDTAAVEQLGSYPRMAPYREPTAEEIQKLRAEEIADSLFEVSVLNMALKLADSQKSKDSFALRCDTLQITYGHLFATNCKHLLIRRDITGNVFIDIYLLKNDHFVQVCASDALAITYVDDTICDINGDKRLDYVFHWYPAAGCCDREVYDIYLQKADGSFAGSKQFINPAFSAEKKIIIGHCYGYYAPLYKYKWNGYNIDTVEYIYLPDSANGQNYIRRMHEDEEERGQVIKQLPGEYRKLGYF